jgi:general secretion pathway protein G
MMRLAIEEYARDNDRDPQSLEDLVKAGYLKEIPTDPITLKKDWQPDFDEEAASSASKKLLMSVHSNSSKIGSNGMRYDAW